MARMADITPYLDLNYKIMGQTADDGTRRQAMMSARAADIQGNAGISPFAGMKAGEDRTFRSFNANQVGDPAKGGMTIISGAPSARGTFDTMRTQGYTPDEAMKAVSIFGDTDLQRVKTGLLPTSTAVANALTAAQTNRTNVETEWMPKLNEASIAESQTRGTVNKASATKLGAEARRTNVDSDSETNWLKFMGLLGSR